LSGGGYRAALFHLGVIRRLNELGLLSRVNVISSVSGGSILSAFLANALRPWPEPGTVLTSKDFDANVAQPFAKFCKRNLRTGPILQRVLLPWNWFRPDTAVRALARTYQRHLNSMTLGELGSRPRFVFCATDMIFGVNWVFDSAPLDKHNRHDRGPGHTPSTLPARIGDYQVGYKNDPAWPIATAVAASSCFPPIFNPLEMHLNPNEFSGGHYGRPARKQATQRDDHSETVQPEPGGSGSGSDEPVDHLRPSDRDKLVGGISLSDGGVYDNLGSQPVMDDYGILLVSDGGAAFRSIQPIGRFDLITRVRRYTAIAGRGGGSMRKRVVIDRYDSGSWQGTLCTIATPPSEFKVGSPQRYADDLVEHRISEIRTDLDCFSTGEQAILQNHGYLQMDAATRTHLSTSGLLPNPIPDVNPPFEDYLSRQAVESTLAHSNKRKLLFKRCR
jgi:NTE family protein